MNKFGFLVLAMTALLFSGCGKIPAAYQGVYLEHATGAKLELKGGEGILTTQNGQVLQTPAVATDVKALQKGTPGIYVRDLDGNKNTLEVFWINPRPETVREESGFVTMISEILYTRMDAHLSGKAQAIQVRFCSDGQVNVDVPSQTFNGGCPSDSLLLNFERAATR